MEIDSKWLSPERFAEYLSTAGEDVELASRLYEWNAAASAALFEIIHHFEVLLRNSIVMQLEKDGPSPALPPEVLGYKGPRTSMKYPPDFVSAGRMSPPDESFLV